MNGEPFTMPDRRLRRRLYDRFFGRKSVIVAATVLLLAVLHPPRGLGVPVCWMKHATGMPCPGCGLSRSLSSSVRGDFATAWKQHPCGPILLPIFAGIVVVALLPISARRRFFRWVGRHPRLVNGLYGLLIAGFLTFGTARAGYHFYLRWSTPLSAGHAAVHTASSAAPGTLTLPAAACTRAAE
ncbi:MAG: DUF2752 domain-containing protein [Phycisphaerae bacterium]|nr:DUF2752 domain-containing protein [Phycisphaerae bacterium]